MNFGGLRASLILLDRREPEPRQSARALMAYVGFIALGNTEDLTAGRTGHMKGSAAIAFAHVIDERASARRAVRRQKAQRDLRIAVPENASVLASGARAAWPGSGVEFLKAVERQQADAHRGLGAPLRRCRMSVRTNEIAMSGPDIFHHPPESLYVLYVYLALPSLRVDDDPSAVIGVVPRFD